MARPLTQAIIDSDPTIQAIARSQGGTGRGDTAKHIQANQKLLAYLQSRGYEFPQGQWVDQSGKLADMPKGMNWWALLAPASVAGAAGLAGLLGGGAAGGVLPSTTLGTGASTLPAVSASGAVPAALAGGAVPAATAGTVLPSTVLGTGAATLPGGASSGAVQAALGAAAAGGGSKSLWSKIAAPLISAGANVGQGLIASNAAKKAAEQQQAATMAALGLQEKIWAQQQANLAPYMQTGTGALSRLNGLTTLRPASQVFGG